MNELTELTAAVIAALKSPEIIKSIYGDLLKPGVKQVGMAVERILKLPNIALWHIDRLEGHVNIALEANLEAYREEMSKVSEDKVVEVRPELGVPVMEKMSYVGDSELSRLYVALLTSASNLDTSDAAHPAFVNVINCLSPDEARLLQAFARKGRHPFVEGQFSNTEGSIVVIPFLVLDELIGSLALKQNLAPYLSNLEGLGIIRVSNDKWMTGPGHYEALEAVFLNSGATPPPGYALNAQKGLIEVTPYGHLFLRGCKVVERQQAG